MDEIIKLLEEGRFTCDKYTARLENGIEIWTGNGAIFYNFNPDIGVGFTLWEKWRLAKAFKKGMILKASTPPEPTV